MAHDEDCLMAVREDTAGRLVEKAALRFDLAQPARDQAQDRDGRDDVRDARGDAGAGRARERRLRGLHGAPPGRSTRIGLPDPAYFIFYDDVDFAIRARRAGFRSGRSATRCWCGSSTSTSSTTWSPGRATTCTATCSSVHFRYGENVLVRLKPWLITAVVVVLSPLRGGRAEARNVIRALRDARGMRKPPARIRRLTHASPPRGDPSREQSSFPDLVVVGSGFFGLTIAERCANELGSRCWCWSAATTSAATPTARTSRDRHRGAHVRRAPLPHLQRAGLGVRQPLHVVHRLPAPGVREVPGPGLLASR